MTHVITPFSYKDYLVRTVKLDNGELGFYATDIAKVLKHSNPTEMVSNLDDDEKITLRVTESGVNRSVIILTEPGLYTVLIRSNKPQAKPFRRWVTHEVLPQIRKTGIYSGIKGRLDDQIYEHAAIQKISDSYSKTLATLGITGNAAVLAVNQEIIKLTGGEINPLASSGNTYLLAEKQEQLFTATEIGKKVGLTAMKENQRNGEGKLFYELTEKGKASGQYLDTGSSIKTRCQSCKKWVTIDPEAIKCTD